MSKEDVAKLVGADKAAIWPEEPMSVADIESSFSVQVVGETTVKPTSAVKKQQALQISQILGQFASATPVVATVMLKILSKAFDEAAISKEDWELIMQSIQMQMQMQAAQIMNMKNQVAATQAPSAPAQPGAAPQQMTLQDVVSGAVGG